MGINASDYFIFKIHPFLEFVYINNVKALRLALVYVKVQLLYQ